jgi:hypothetical protein
MFFADPDSNTTTYSGIRTGPAQDALEWKIESENQRIDFD